MSNNMNSFIGCESNYKNAGIVLYGIPFDNTTSFRPGTRFGSNAIRNESYGLEEYSVYQDTRLSDYAIHDAGDLECPFGDTSGSLSIIEKFSRKVVKDGKIPVALGGEHLVSYACIIPIAQKYPDLAVIHFDAHTDLRDDYLKQKFSHATVMRRISEIVKDKNIYQFGIRSGEKEEFDFAKAHTNMYKYDLEGLRGTLKNLKGIPVYFSLDLDVLDPSVFSGTGTPEPGGVSFKELHNAVLALKELNIVGADIVELSPHYDISGASTAAACKITREILLAIGGNINE